MPLVSEITSITQRLIIPKVVDNIYKASPFFYRLKKKGIVEQGGREIVVPIISGQEGDVTYFSEGQAPIIPHTVKQTISSATFRWKGYAFSMIIPEYDLRVNLGTYGIVNLMKAKTQNLALRIATELGNDMINSTGTGQDANKIEGLEAIVNTTTYGGGSNC